MRAHVEPELLRWAADRVGWTQEVLHEKFPKFDEWEAGSVQPTLKQIEMFSHATHAPLGFLFLPQPPIEELPIPDFRTMKNAGMTRLSPDLLDTIYICQSRQAWYRAYAPAHGYLPLEYVGSATIAHDVEPLADEIRRLIRFTLSDRSAFTNWEVALRQLIDRIEDIGVLVMVNGVVGADTHRKLNPQEFRGFALLAP